METMAAAEGSSQLLVDQGETHHNRAALEICKNVMEVITHYLNIYSLKYFKQLIYFLFLKGRLDINEKRQIRI